LSAISQVNGEGNERNCGYEFADVGCHK
jgi:hypothetical protein